MKKVFLYIGFIAIFFCLCKDISQTASNTPTDPAVGKRGMVSTAHPLATQAGVDVLSKGGNAFDAAVAIAAVLNVVEPMMSGMGGYGTIVVYDSEKRQARFLNSSSRIPRAVDSDVYRPPTPGFLENRRGAKAVSTPGNVHAWEAMSREYGKMTWKELFQPAIKLAEQGFEIGQLTAKMIEWAFPSFPEHAKAFYGSDGKPLIEGMLLIQKNLAESLRLVAEHGANAFYSGAIAQAIDKTMREAGGFLSIDDLRADKAEWWEPIKIDYKKHEVITASPPSTAFPSLIRLGMMSRFDNKALGHNTAQYLHHFAEVTKHAFWCRLAYAGDPEFTPPPLDRLLSESYWEEQTAKIDSDKAVPFQYPGILSDEDKHTTHFVVTDRWGNIVCATQTLGNAFGSRIMPEGTGIWLNNSLAYCTFEPEGNPMDAHAGHHKLSGDCPTLILKDGKPWVAVGTPGGHTIGQTVPQMVMNIIDFDMNIQEAIAAPRISFIEPDIIAIENKIPKDVQNELSQKGHKIRETRGLGDAHGLMIEYNAKGKPKRFYGGADPRGQGVARGW
jgi:gamma-glutamyltranspeptidase/glutathione hydrolase